MNQHNSYSHTLHLLLFLFLSFQIPISTSSISASNEYETDSDKYWKSTSYFKPFSGRRYERLKRRKSMYFAVKFQYYGKTAWDKWENILRIGNYADENDPFGCGGHGNRYPGLYILPSNNGLQISLSNSGDDCWFVIEDNYNLLQNIIYSLIIEYNQTHSSVLLETYNATTNQMIKPFHLISNSTRVTDDTLLGQYMDVIISDPKTAAANVSLWDIVIISYDDLLTFPTESPTTTPTMSPTIATDPPTTTTENVRDNIDVEVRISMDYTANNTNQTQTDAVIRDITEEIINNYINQISNGSNHTIIHVIISDIENKEYDIVLISNYTIDNKDIAIKLEVLFENKLETELMNKMRENNNSITIKEIDIDITVIPPSDKSENISTTETTNILNVLSKNDNMPLIWILFIAGCFIMVCCLLIGFYIGIKYNGHRTNKSRQLRVRTQSNVLNEYGNIQNNCKLKQNDSDNENDEYSEHAQLGHIMAMESTTNEQETDIINNIRNDIFSVAMGTPVGISNSKTNNRNNSTSELQIVDNITNIQLNKLDDMDENDDDLDIEDMYNYTNTKGNINISPQISDFTAEGNSVETVTSQ